LLVGGLANAGGICGVEVFGEGRKGGGVVERGVESRAASTVFREERGFIRAGRGDTGGNGGGGPPRLVKKRGKLTPEGGKRKEGDSYIFRV